MRFWARAPEDLSAIEVIHIIIIIIYEYDGTGQSHNEHSLNCNCSLAKRFPDELSL